MTNKVLQQVLNEAAREAQRRKETCDNLRALAYSIVDISNAQAEYSKLKFECIWNNSADNSQKVADAREKYFSALGAHGYSESDFLPKPACSACNDSFYVDGVLCQCVRERFLIALAKECEIDKRAPFSFQDNFLSPALGEQKSKLDKLYSYCSDYVEKIPNVKYKILLFTGATGTGKSCLASAMVRKAVCECGKSGLFLSAYELNSLFLKYHTSFIAEREAILSDVLSADLLVIDDLGTEPILKNVTLEYLIVLLDERVRAGLSTVVTTNLDEGALKSRYGERIFSRLTDFHRCLFRRLDGKDLRHAHKAE